MKIEKFQSIQEIKNLWLDLYNENPDLTVFQSYQWNVIQEQHFYGQKLLYISCELIYFVCNNFLIFPLIINRLKKKIFFLGQEEPSDYLSPIYKKNLSDIDFDQFISYLKEHYHQYELILDRINTSNPFYRVVEQYSVSHNINIIIKECVKIHLNTESNTFYESLSKSARQNYRTAKNRLAKDGKSYEIIIEQNHLSPKKIIELYSLYKERRNNKDKNSKFKIIFIKFLKTTLSFLGLFKKNDILSLFSKNNKTFLAEIKINQELAAFCEGVTERNKTLTIIRVATNNKYYKYSPGQILLIDTIEQIKNKFEVFDLTRGTEDYKFHLGGKIHNNYCLSFKL